MSCRHCNCNPCKCESSCDPANEPLRSMLLNFLLKQLGQPEQVCVNGEVMWVLPCGLDAGSISFPKLADESIDCYFLRWLESLEASIQPAFLIANNLSEGDVPTMIANLGLDNVLRSTDISVLVQAYSAALTAWAAKTAPSGTVVGTSDSQTLTNKTFTNAGNTRQTLTDAATIAWNADLGSCAVVALGANRAMGAPTNLKVGTYILETTGAFGITSWDAIFDWGSGTAPTAGGTKNIYTFYYNGTKMTGTGVTSVS